MNVVSDVRLISEFNTKFVSSAKSISDINLFVAELKKQNSIKKAKQKKPVICCFGFASKEGVKRVCFEHGITVFNVDNLSDIDDLPSGSFAIAEIYIDEAFETKDYIFIPDTKIIGKRIEEVKRQINKDVSRLLRQVSLFTEGDLVVHKEFGVAIFRGLRVISHAGKDYEMIDLKYCDEEMILLPIDRINMISKFSVDPNDTRDIELYLDSLSKETFRKKKAKAKERVKEIAEKIINLAAKRKLSEGKIFAKMTEVSDKFYDEFPYIPTEDQENAFKDIENDFASGNPADRLICGDVGFGKTEVAMRAAFLVCSGKMTGDYYGQVAIVVPTTLLARQHYNNFIKRFKNTNIAIEELSRTKTPKQKAKILQSLENGEIDIIIGTHSLLASSVKFKNLDLVIIDEEQHFGVRQKEKLKDGREFVHFLSFSATPIPRTLNMSLSGLKDISIIAKPPVDRVATQTFVMPYDDIVIRNAILREKERLGRTFFVCPRIIDLDDREEYLKKIVPEISIAKIHGRLTSDEIDSTMIAFYEGKYDLLLTTNIIESGIDISFANTIIIHKADMFGLGSLYQLRGRVGRSGTNAYAYFMISSKQFLNQNALLRLKTIANIAGLGAGFSIASSDMDIRGVGNVVGEEQSGSIKDVGTELFQEMIADEIRKLNSKSQTNQNTQSTDVTIDDINPEIKVSGLSILIPKDYITDFNLRLEFYKKISSCKAVEELDIVSAEMTDRFGKVPSEILNLINIVELKVLCKKFFISRLDSGSNGIVFSIHKCCPKDVVDKIIKKTTDKSLGLSIKPDSKLFISYNCGENVNLIKKKIIEVFA